MASGSRGLKTRGRVSRLPPGGGLAGLPPAVFSANNRRARASMRCSTHRGRATPKNRRDQAFTAKHWCSGSAAPRRASLAVSAPGHAALLRSASGGRGAPPGQASECVPSLEGGGSHGGSNRLSAKRQADPASRPCSLHSLCEAQQGVEGGQRRLHPRRLQEPQAQALAAPQLQGAYHGSGRGRVFVHAADNQPQPPPHSILACSDAATAPAQPSSTLPSPAHRQEGEQG